MEPFILYTLLWLFSLNIILWDSSVCDGAVVGSLLWNVLLYKYITVDYFAFFFLDELHRFYQLLSPIFHCLVSFSEKAMATHPSTLAWKIPWTEAPGRLQSLGSLRARHDWATSLSLFTFMHWRRKWQPTPVFLPGEPRNGGTWWAAIYGVTQSQTRLKRLSSSSRWHDSTCRKF